MVMRSEFTEVTLELMDEIHAFREELRKGRSLPYMEEPLSGRKLRARWPFMDVEGRRKIIGKLGTDRTLQILRGNNNGRTS